MIIALEKLTRVQTLFETVEETGETTQIYILIWFQI